MKKKFTATLLKNAVDHNTRLDQRKNQVAHPEIKNAKSKNNKRQCFENQIKRLQNKLQRTEQGEDTWSHDLFFEDRGQPLEESKRSPKSFEIATPCEQHGEVIDTPPSSEG